MKCPNCGQPDDYGYCHFCNICTNQEEPWEIMPDTECEICGEPSDYGICECCEFIKHHPEVQRNELDRIFWIGVEIEAMEQAAEKTLFRRNADDLKNGICKLNRKLKKKN